MIVTGSVLYSVNKDNSEVVSRGFAVVIDAGSSHTSWFLFDLTWNEGFETALAKQVNECYIRGAKMK